MTKSEIKRFDNAVQLVVWSKSEKQLARVKDLMVELADKLEATSD